MPIPSLHPDAARKAELLWCQPNPTQAWIDWMRKGKLPSGKANCENPVAEPLRWANNSASTVRRPWSSLTAAAKAVTALCPTSKKSSRKTSNTGLNLHQGRFTRPFFISSCHQLLQTASNRQIQKRTCPPRPFSFYLTGRIFQLLSGFHPIYTPAADRLGFPSP